MGKKVFVATYSTDALSAIRKYNTGIELNDFCYSENLDADKIDKTFGYIEKELEQSGADDIIIHGPFTEIIPASIDHRAVEFGMNRLEECYSAARKLGVNRMVVHSGFMPLLYFKEWNHEKSVYFWRKFMSDKPENFTIYIENVFEDEPLMMKAIIEELNDPRIKICLDVGHANAVKLPEYPVVRWIEILGEHIGHFHLHNNDGEHDLHLALTQGDMDMDSVMDAIARYCDPQVTMTIESRVLGDSIPWLMEKNGQ